MEYLLSTVRQYAGESPVAHAEIINNLTTLSHLPFNFETPDGYPEKGDDQLGTARIMERIKFNQLIYESFDSIDYDDVRSVMIANGVALSDAEEVVGFWMDRIFAGNYTDLDRDLAEEFLTTDDEGDPQTLFSGASTYNLRVRKMLSFLAGYPQNLKQ
jgi:hypothetical protein